MGSADTRNLQQHSIFQRLLVRFQNRLDTEHEQSLMRLAVVIVVLIYTSVFTLLDATLPEHGVFILALYLGFSLLIFVATARDPAVSVPRRISCMFGDIGMITYLLYCYGENMTPLYIFYLWASSAYGLRYGNRYLAATTILAAIGFLFVIRYNEYWLSNSTTAWGLWAGLLVLPIYFAALLDKLSQALKAEETANQAKSRFLANMSHEIRTPIHGVIGQLELLSKTPLMDKQRTLLQGAQSSSATLLHLLENVLDISKIEAGRISLTHETFDLHRLINDVVSLFVSEAGTKNLLLKRYIDPNCPYLLVGDEFHLRQVLVNLVGNAVKFTEQGRVVLQVMCDLIEPDRACLRIEVNDTGIGISEEAQDYIFEPFRQEDDRITRRFGGTGLGMSIARQLTNLMGGTLTVSSVVGQGSTFTLMLACERAEVPSKLPPLELPTGVHIISGDQDLISQIHGHCVQWHLVVSCGQEIAPLMSDNTLLLLDERSLSRAATVLRDYPELSKYDLVLLSEDATAFDILEAGYCAKLHLPIGENLLYTLLHSFQRLSDKIGTEHLNNEDSSPFYEWKIGRILVADDNQINQRLTCTFLEQAGHSVTVASDGGMALDALEKQPFDLAILDMMMPGYGGLDVIKHYRRGDVERNIPFIILTANASNEARSACENLDVKYLMKPLHGHSLLVMVQELL
jgi:two-component system sensor histidine kinase RpfC